ncbi:MAG TPA: ABC transporter ATP-binding protein [Solirubrobacteraceae bacterium]
MLELRELIKSYPSVSGETVSALDGVSLTLGEGEFLALYGPSGSGKTTLLMLIAALLSPDSGVVAVNGRELLELGEREAADYRLRELGFVRQSLELIPGVSAIENAALKLLACERGMKAARKELSPLFERLGIAERSEHLSEQLSAGERQRVAIARALSTGPRLLLADEPTGSLDSERGAQVLELLRELCRERSVTLLLVTHDERAVSYADRALELRDGKLIRRASSAHSIGMAPEEPA